MEIDLQGPYAFIQSKLGNVIEIQGASNAAGALLDANTQDPGRPSNQLWKFVPDPAGSGCYYILSMLNGHAIDNEGAVTLSGGVLKSEPQAAVDASSQLWYFVSDPEGSGYCFIVSKANGSVIDVPGTSLAAGTLLRADPIKLAGYAGYDGQLWTVVEGGFPSVVQTVPQSAGRFSGSVNYILASGSNCATLTNVRVMIFITEDLVWYSSQWSKTGRPPQGFSVQLNTETSNTQPLDWLQFTTHMGDDQGVWPWINIWQSTSEPVLWDQKVKDPVATMPQAARIPAGYFIVITLQSDNEGRITGASWLVLDNLGHSIGTVSYPLSNAEGGGVPPDDLSPIASFQVTFGGVSDGAHATFSSGAGVIIFAADQTMTVDTSYPPCIGYVGGTGETSNITYGPLPAIPNTVFAQAFGVPPASTPTEVANAPPDI